MCGVRASKSAICTSRLFTSSPSIHSVYVYHLLKALHQGHKVSSLSSLCRSPPIAKQHMEEMSTGHCSDINVATCLGTNFQSQQNIAKHEMVWKSWKHDCATFRHRFLHRVSMTLKISSKVIGRDGKGHVDEEPCSYGCIILRSIDSGTYKRINSYAQRRATLTNFSMRNRYVFYVSSTSGCYIFTFNIRNQM